MINKHEELINTNSELLSNLVSTYFGLKKKTKFLTVRRENYEYPEGEMGYYEPMSDEDIALLKQLQQQYGQDWMEHLEEGDLKEELKGNDDFIAIDWDEEPTYIATVTLHFILPNDEVKQQEERLYLTQAQYCKLLQYHLSHSYLSLNCLMRIDSNLYSEITSQLMARIDPWEDGFSNYYQYPYAAVLTEFEEEVERFAEFAKPFLQKD